MSEPTERFELGIVQSKVFNALLQRPVGVISILDEPGEVLLCWPNIKLPSVILYAVYQVISHKCHMHADIQV